MKFLCTKVKEFWLTSMQNREKVTGMGLSIEGAFIGIKITSNEPSPEESKIVNEAIVKLFDNHIKAFPVRVMDL